MVTDMHPKVWLETVPGTIPALVRAYVQTDHEARMMYHMDVIKNGRSGSSRISQSGTVNASAGTPTRLTSVAMSSQPGDQCEIAVTLREGQAERGTFRFDCPR